MESSFARNRNSFIIVLVYFVILFLNMVIDKMSSYGYIQSMVFSVVFFFCNNKKDNIRNIILTIVLLLPVLLFSRSNFLYYINDSLTLFLVLSCIDAFKIFSLSEKQSRIVSAVLLIYAILFLVCTIFPSFYDGEEGRYRGLFGGVNISSSVIVLIIAYLLEFFKGKRLQFVVYVIAFACFLVSLFLCNTRSVFFVVPFLLWLYKGNINFKKAWPFILLIVTIGGYLIVSNSASMLEDLRLSEEDTSYLTRAFLYEKEFEGISQNYYIKPHGFNACITFVKNLTDNDSFSPHNDLLAYWYDWGLAWLITLVILFVRIRRYVKSIDFKYGSILLFFFVVSCALHNVMLNICIWIPLILIMWRARIIRDNI